MSDDDFMMIIPLMSGKYTPSGIRDDSSIVFS